MASTPEDVNGIDSDILSQLSSVEGKSLLDTIDNLRAIKVGELVNLPQIIVVGDQSSGKSSVLEAISRVRFPVDDDVCTRFASELVLRRANETRVTVSIQYADRPTYPEQLGEEPQPFRRSSFEMDVLPEIINEAKERMQIRKGEFSKDVLRVEVHGPEMESLTLVDLPGFFHSATSDQSKEGKEIVHELIQRYMRQDKSIILAVVAANYNYASQAVLEEVQRHDPTRERTLGVVTKPDLAGHGMNCRKYIDLVNGLEPEHNVSLGWFVLRNRSDDERDLSFELRDLKEQVLFKSGEWSTIRHTSRGVENLRKKLSKVLLEHIKRSLPDLIHDIDDKLSENEEKLKRLGQDRSQVDDQRLYLLEIAEKFKRLANDAVEGRYSDPFFGDLGQDANKLRAILRKLNQAFAAILARRGRAYDIDALKASNGSGGGKYQLDSEEREFLDYLQPFMENYSVFQEPQAITSADFKRKIDSLMAQNLGRGLCGTPTSGLALQLFRLQMRPWREIAQFHLDLILGISKAFVERLFSHIIGPEKATEISILKEYVDPFFEMKKEVLDAKLRELLRPHEEGYGLPLETRFHKAVSRSTINRLAGKLAAFMQEEFGESFQDRPKKALRSEMIVKALVGSDDFQSSEIEKERVIDMMETHYEMSLTTFTDNVISLAVESCLVCDIPNILTPAAVFTMKTDTLEKLAAQSEEVLEERVMLQARVKTLKEGLETCRRSRPREATVAPSIIEIPAAIHRADPEPKDEALSTTSSKTVVDSPPPSPTGTEETRAGTDLSGTTQAPTPQTQTACGSAPSSPVFPTTVTLLDPAPPPTTTVTLLDPAPPPTTTVTILDSAPSFPTTVTILDPAPAFPTRVTLLDPAPKENDRPFRDTSAPDYGTVVISGSTTTSGQLFRASSASAVKSAPSENYGTALVSAPKSTIWKSGTLVGGKQPVRSSVPNPISQTFTYSRSIFPRTG